MKGNYLLATHIAHVQNKHSYVYGGVFLPFSKGGRNSPTFQRKYGNERQLASFLINDFSFTAKKMEKSHYLPFLCSRFISAEEATISSKQREKTDMCKWGVISSHTVRYF